MKDSNATKTLPQKRIRALLITRCFCLATRDLSTYTIVLAVIFHFFPALFTSVALSSILAAPIIIPAAVYIIFPSWLIANICYSSIKETINTDGQYTKQDINNFNQNMNKIHIITISFLCFLIISMILVILFLPVAAPISLLGGGVTGFLIYFEGSVSNQSKKIAKLLKPPIPKIIDNSENERSSNLSNTDSPSIKEPPKNNKNAQENVREERNNGSHGGPN